MATKRNRTRKPRTSRARGRGKPAAKRAAVPRRAAKSPRTAVSRKAKAAAAPARRRGRQFPESLRIHALSPSLTVNDLGKSISFYVDGLGFVIEDRWEREGKLMGVMLRAGNAAIALSQDDWSKGRERVKGVGISFYAETRQSLELIAALAKEHAIEADGPKLASWGDRILEFRDPDGYKLTLYWPQR